MIKKLRINNAQLIAFLLVMIIFILPARSYAQFIDLQLEIESKLSAATVKQMNFGILSANSGRRMIELGSLNMGVFSITGLEEQLLLVNLDKPDKLQHENPAIDENIPLQLFCRYGYSFRNYRDSIGLPDATSTIKLEANPEPGPWNTIYLFMYGSIDIGNVAEGVYSNDIILNVEYI